MSSGFNRKSKVMIISLDGFTWKIGYPDFITDVMPKLGFIRDCGNYGILASVLPYETCPAWAAFQSGCFPQKTGIYSFFKTDYQGGLDVNSASDLQVPVIMDILDQKNRYAIYINLPLTYPTHINHGIVIPGLPCPEINEETVYPASVYHDYIANANYEIVNTSDYTCVKNIVDTQIAVEQSRLKVGLQLLKNYDWDLFCYHIQSTDHLQHRLWPALDVKHSQHNPEEYEQVKRFYRACDFVITDLVNNVSSDTLIFIISDHGFEAVTYLFYLNSWLRQKNYLKLKSHFILKQKIWQVQNDIKAKLKQVIPGVKFIAEHLGPRLAPIKYSKKQRDVAFAGRGLQNKVDFKKTDVFSLACLGGVGYVREKNVNLESLFRQLMTEYGPDADIPIIKTIHTYPQVNRANRPQEPAFIVEYNKEIFGILDPLVETEVRKTHYSLSPGCINGTHSPEGVIVMHGPGVKRGGRVDARIVDIMPTVLAYMGLPVPRHVDGRVLQEAFEKPLDVSYEDAVKGEASAPVQYSESEQAAIEKKLGDLGYL